MELTPRQLEIIRAINAGGNGKPEYVLVEQFGEAVRDELKQLIGRRLVEIRHVEPLQESDGRRMASPPGEAYYALTDDGQLL